MMDEITIVVIDDHPLFRQGVIGALSLEADLRVIGQASDGEEGLDLIRVVQPRVAIVDVNLPGMNGQQVTRRVIAERLPTRVILLTAYDDIEQKIHAMRVGASAYCTKDIRPEMLVDNIRSVAAGQFVIGDQVLGAEGVEKWLQEWVQGALQLYSDPGEPFQPLSEREMEVLSHVTRGLSNKEIAALLGISHQTVKNHITSILRKLGVDDRTQATLYALRRGWVRLYQEDQ
ncbi:MAG: response regulator transcription factor [Anaerolineales bacterium]|nr:response regulator transcription factor [Anaerolineales bacterium]